MPVNILTSRLSVFSLFYLQIDIEDHGLNERVDVILSTTIEVMRVGRGKSPRCTIMAVYRAQLWE